MRAFRGYFKVEGYTGVTPRLRIVVGEQGVTELETVTEADGNSTEVRKYIENGVLVIERNGVRYDATGARME